jgi:hypothetical protein
MAELFALPFAQALDSDGNPISGATLSFFTSGTSTPEAVYSNATLSTSLGAVVTANAAGRFVAIYLDPTVYYRAVLKDAGGTTISDVDPYSGGLISPEMLENSDAARSGFAAVLGIIDGGNPISITGATTLDATAFGRLFVISGSAADYTVTLPSASGQAGNSIAFRVSLTATKLFTLSAGGASIGTNLQSSYVLWAGESVTIASDGTSWQIVDRYRRPFSGFVQRTSALSLTVGVYAPIVMSAAGGDITGLNLCFDSTNGRFRAPRLANWIFSATASIAATAGTRTTCDLGLAYNNITTPQSNLLDTTYYEVGDVRRFLKVVSNFTTNAGDYIVPIARANGGTSPTVEYAAGAIVPTLYFTEVPL